MQTRIITKVISCLFVFLIILSVDVYAQDKAQIAGVISDASTGEYLPGANIYIQGTNHGVSSDRSGKYRINQVPLGEHTVIVSYIGYEQYTTVINLNTANRTLNLDIELQITAVELDDIVVSGLLQGQVKAFNQQLNANEIKNVLSREEMEKFPDMNTAEAMQRIPGVNIARDQGEGTFVYIRGTEPRLTGITVNGQKLASSDDEKRITDLGIINSGELAFIEVIKVLTPEMDASGIGGQVNLVTRSPFDYEKPVIKMEAGGGYELQGNLPQYRMSASYTGFFSEERKFGFSVSGSYYENNINGQSVSTTWRDIRDANRNDLLLNINDFDLFNKKSQRDHFGLSGVLEYRPDKDNSYHISAMYNLKHDNQHYNNLYYRLSSGRWMSETAVTNARMDFTYINQIIDQQLFSVSTGGVHNFDGLELDYDINYSFGDQVFPDSDPRIRSEWAYENRVNFLIDMSDVNYPKFTPTNRDENFYTDPSKWTVDAQEYKYREIVNHNIGGVVNVKMPFELFSIPAEFQTGVKFSSEIKKRDGYVNRYLWKGDGDLYFNEVASDEQIEDFLNNNYILAPMGDRDKAKKFIEKYTELGLSLEDDMDDPEGYGGNYDNQESVFSAYFMTTFNIGPMMVLTGVRDEYTNTEYNGMKIFEDNQGDYLYMEPAGTKSSYNNLFPYLHFKYKVTPTMNIRAAYTKSISRPNYFDLAPYFWISPENSTIVRGNPDLSPTLANNFDLVFENYFHGIGVISIGGFYKILDDIIYQRTYQEIGGQYDGYTFSEPTNAGSSRLYGFEINWQQQFTFLPGFLSGFGIYANYTKTKSEADLEFRDWSVLPGQAGDVGNLGLSYEKYGLTARLSLNFNSPVLVGVGLEPRFDTYTDEQKRLDFSAVYKIFNNLSFFLDMVNITNERDRVYMGVTEKPTKIEFFGMSIRSGVKLDL